MFLQGKKIFLRTPVPADALSMYKWENNPSLQAVNVNYGHVSVSDINAWIKTRKHDLFLENELRLMICDGHKTVIGAIDLFEFDVMQLSAGVGIIVDEDKRKSGIATEAVNMLSDFCFSKFRFSALWCNIPSFNTPSIKLFSGCGFEEIKGYTGKYLQKGSAFYKRIK
jgi:diamine N-acetyltransferase